MSVCSTIPASPVQRAPRMGPVTTHRRATRPATQSCAMWMKMYPIINACRANLVRATRQAMTRHKRIRIVMLILRRQPAVSLRDACADVGTETHNAPTHVEALLTKTHGSCCRAYRLVSTSIAWMPTTKIAVFAKAVRAKVRPAITTDRSVWTQDMLRVC